MERVIGDPYKDNMEGKVVVVGDVHRGGQEIKWHRAGSQGGGDGGDG